MKLPYLKPKKSESLPVRRRFQDTPPVRSDSELNSAYMFRRNRTITGSRSSLISSASEHDANLQSPRATAHSLRKKRRSLGLLTMGVLAALITVTILLLQFSASTTISIYGQVRALDAKDQAYYGGLVNEYFGRYPAQRLRWWLDSQQLANYLQQRNASEVEDIHDVQPHSLGVTAITLKMREPVASWVIDGVQQYVDDSGTIYARNYFETPRVKIIDESGLRPSHSHTVASGRFLGFIGQSVGQFRRFGLTPQAVIIPPDTTRQAQLELNDGTRIKLSVDRLAGEQAEDAKRAANYLAAKGIKTKYVDVRVGGKAFYLEK